MQTLDQLIEEYKSVLIAEKHLEYIHQELEKLRNEMGRLSTTVDAIAEVLEKPESPSIKRLFSQTLVNEDEQYELNKQEYLLAALKYQECLKAIELLEFEQKIVAEKVEKKLDLKSKLNMAIDLDNQQVKEYPNTHKRLLEVNTAINDIIQYKRELYEAYQVALSVSKSLIGMERELKNAQQYDNWGHFYNEIQHGKAYKKAYMDKAHLISHQANREMRRLKKELDDIFQFKPNTSMSTFEELMHFQDHFHDSLITDWVVENDVVVSLSRVITTRKYMERIIASIKKYQAKSEAKLTQLKESKDYIIANAEANQ